MKIYEGNESIASKIVKGAYFVIGSISLLAGIIGLFLPVIPTTPFILLSGWCYLRSSEKIYSWLIKNETFGKTIEDYHTGKGINKSTKTKAISLMWLTISISVIFFVSNLYLRGTLLTTAILVSIYIIKQPTIE
jgi:uncharacterized membrane protein YbaN (DUF454 family)